MNDINTMSYNNSSIMPAGDSDNSNNLKVIIYIIAACGTGACFLYGCLYSKKKITSTFAVELDEASSRYSEQEENEMLDLETIDIAIKAFKQESEFFIGNSPEQKEIQRSIFKPATENTALIGPRDNGCCDQLMSELRFLMKTYPKASSGRATIENLESDALASRVHHEKVLSIAEILLPNLSSLLNEARLIKNRLSVGAQC